MIKKLTARVQKLNPALKDNESVFSFCLTIEPESKDLSLTKGSLYSIFDLKGKLKFDIDITQKLIKDVLSDTYYNTQGTSPTQSIEKALVKVKNTIYELQKKYGDTQDTLSFSAVVAVLWGDVFYIVKYNDCLAYIMKQNSLEPIETLGEGNLHFASVKVDQDQVVILCTKEFGIKYPPNILLTKALSQKDLELTDSCLLLKFIVDTTVTAEELKSLNVLASPKKAGLDNIVELLSQKFQTFNPTKAVINKSLVNAKPKISKSKNLISKKVIQDFAKKFNTKKNLTYSLFFLLIFTALAVLFYYLPFNRIQNIFIRQQDNMVQVTNEVPNNTTPQKQQTTQAPEPILDDTSQDEELLIERVSNRNILYDMTIFKKEFDAKSLMSFNNSLLIQDATSDLFSTFINRINFTVLPYDFANGEYFTSNEQNNILFYKDNAVQEYDTETNLVVNSYNINASNSMATFNDFLYTFQEDTIYRYSLTQLDNNQTTWAQSDDFINAKKMQIAYSIYVLTNDNNILKYTTGRPDEFEINGIDIDTKEINDFVVKPDFDNIYISDPLNNRVVVVDAQGDYVKQFKYVDNMGFSNIKSIAVTDDESTLFILNNNVIYEIAL